MRTKQRQEIHNANIVHRIYIRLVNVPEKCPGDLPAHFHLNSNTNQTNSNSCVRANSHYHIHLTIVNQLTPSKLPNTILDLNIHNPSL